MYHYEYVSKRQAAPYKKNLIELIKRAQNEVRDYFTFQFTFIGSASRNMITFDPRTNHGFDFDVNIEVNDDDETYSPEDIWTILRNALTRVIKQYGYNKCEESTRVLTIKHIDSPHSKISYSCDFAIIYCGENGQQYIRFNKKAGTYTWEFQKQLYDELEDRSDFLSENGHWSEVRKVYLDKKNFNNNLDKHSRSLYAESINECYRRYSKY